MVGNGKTGTESSDSAPRADGLLDGWKAIADYLGKTERTVQRWEKKKGLPVRRFQSELPEEQSRVFAYQLEIDAWLDRQTTPTVDEASIADEAEEIEPPAPVEPASKSDPFKRFSYFIAPLILGLTIALALWPRIRWWLRPGEAKILGVVPVRNLGGAGDPEPQQLAEALTEEMVTGLGRLQPKRFRVIELSPAREGHAPDQFGNSHLDYLLEGSVRRAGNRIAITAQLILAKDQSRIWGNSYERDLDSPQDMIPIEIEIRDAILKEVLPLLPRENPPAREVNRAAYESYLWGRLFWNQRTPQSLFKARDAFQKAIDIDSTYAPAYAGLADCYFLLGSVPYTALPPNQAFPQAEAAAKKALELDSSLAEAHISLGYSALVYRRDFQDAEQHFQSAIAMRPEYPAAHEFYGYYLSAMGRTNEAIKERQTARDLEPLSPIFNSALGEAYFQARQFDRSIEETQKSLDADPSYEDALMNIARAYEQKGMYDRSEAVLRQLLARAPEEPAILSMAGHEYAVSGHRSQAREIISRLESIAGRRYVPPLYFALIYIGLGDRDKAFQFLNKAYDERSEYLLYLPTEPLADPLRNDPRFRALLDRLGLTVESSRAVRSPR